MSSYISEKVFLDEVEKCLIACGHKTWREVIPDACKDWENPYSVDLIFYCEKNGYIGVEGKNIKTPGQGSIIACAVDQIENKYRNQTYFNGNIISRWCVSYPTESSPYIDDRSMERINMFVKTFLNKMYNISLLEYKPSNSYNTASIVIDSTTPHSIYIRQNKRENYGKNH